MWCFCIREQGKCQFTAKTLFIFALRFTNVDCKAYIILQLGFTVFMFSSGSGYVSRLTAPTCRNLQIISNK